VRYDAAAGRSRLVLADADRGLRGRALFAAPGHFGAPAWPPAAARVLLPWPDADQWLFVRPVSRVQLTAVANIAGRFAPGSTRATFPRSVQGCCAGASAG
jgi:hypothetical protein